MLIFSVIFFPYCSIQTEQFHRLYNFPMGNSSRSPEDYDLVCKFNEQNWIKDSNQQGLQIWRNKLTKEAAQVIRLYEIPSIEDMDIYTFRMMENDLIKVYHLSLDQNYDMCALNQLSLLLVQYIPIKLINIRNFDREEALTILSAAFRAFHLLQIKFGPIFPYEEFIGFNQQGKTKIWLNKKSNINYIDRKGQNLQSSIQIAQVSQRVKRLLQIVEQKTKYMLLPPSIREQICHPYTTYLSALKIIQKFAYFQKLNLRKYLQLGYSKNNKPSFIHRRKSSQLTQLKQKHQICCQRNQSSFYQSAIKQPTQLRRMYSVNSIHNRSNNSSIFIPAPIPIPIAVGADRFNQPLAIKHSVMSNSSNIQSIRPSSVNFKHCHVINISTAQDTKFTQASNLSNVDKVNQNHSPPNQNEEIPKTRNILVQKQQVTKQGENQKQKKITEYQQYKVEQLPHPSENQQVSIPSDSNNNSEYQKQNSVKEQYLLTQNISFKEPASPTFVVNHESEHEFRSFAPSQQNLTQLQNYNNLENNANQVIPAKNIQYLYEITAADQKKPQQLAEQRRLSIQNNNKKLQFPNELAINSVSILNYCTSVQSKLHMATNRDHSIIDNKKSIVVSQFNKYQDDQIQQYIREKYNIVQNKRQPNQVGIKMKHETNLQKHHYRHQNDSSAYSKPKKPINNRISPSLNHFEGEQDFLDVNFLEKSLDKRYCNIQNQQKIQQQKRQMQENDALNIAKLQQGLQRFSKSQLSNKNTDHHIQSKQMIQKKQFQYTGSFQHEKQYGMISTFNPLEHSTGFQSYHPFKEKNFNQERFQNAYLNDQSLDYQDKVQKRATNEEKYSKKGQKQYENNTQPNKHQYSFEGNSKSSYSIQNSNKPINRSYYIKETQLSSIQQPTKSRNQDLYPTTNPFDSKQQKTTHRGISYQQLRQFLWN